VTPEEKFAADFERIYGYKLGTGPREHIHPEQWEAEQRQAERAELDRDFIRVYGDGR
jgi:hypothetical protein